MKQLLIIIFFLFCSNNVFSQINDIKTLANNFSNPPRCYGTSCWWWWLNGNASEESVAADIEAMRDKGFHSAIVVDADGSGQFGCNQVAHGLDFGSFKWRELFCFALQQAEKYGIEIGLAIQSGWNLGGPSVMPQNAAKKLVYSVSEFDGDDNNPVILSLEQPATNLGFYKDIAVFAFNKDSLKYSAIISDLDLKTGAKEIGMSAPDCSFLLHNKHSENKRALIDKRNLLNLTARLGNSGRLKWRVPQGQWVVVRIGYTCTGARVSTCSENWNGLVLDHLSSSAFLQYWDSVVNPILNDAKKYVGKTLKYLQTDSWEGGGMNWTNGFEHFFESRFNYSPLPYLVCLAGYVVDNVDYTNAFLADLRKCVAMAVAENHYAVFACKAHQVGLQIMPESAGPHAGPMDGIKNYSYSDIVMSEFWSNSIHRKTPQERFFVKQAASAAHLYGKKIVGAESFTTIGPHWDDKLWQNQRPAFDRAICDGLNRVYFHTFTTSPKEFGVPGLEYFAGTHINPRITWWNEFDAFNNYLRRCQMIVQSSKFVADALYYYGDNVPNIFPFRESDPANVLQGYDYDVADENTILQLNVNKNGDIVAPMGNIYKILVLPNSKALSLSVLEKIKSLLNDGAVVLGNKPDFFATLKGGDTARKRFFKLADSLWCNNTNLYCGLNGKKLLNSIGTCADYQIFCSDTTVFIDCVHYSLNKSDFYFVSNQSEKYVDLNCFFRSKGKNVEIWNAENAQRYGAYLQNDTLKLNLLPYQAVFVVFNNEEKINLPILHPCNYVV